MTLDLEAIRRRNESRRSQWIPSPGDHVSYKGGLGLIHAMIVRVEDDGSLLVEEDLDLSAQPVVDETGVPYATTVGASGRALSVGDCVRVHTREGRVHSLYAKQGELHARVRHTTTVVEARNAWLSSPTAQEDIFSLIAEVERLRARP